MEICKAFIELTKEIKLVFPVHSRTEKYLTVWALPGTNRYTEHTSDQTGRLPGNAGLNENAGKILTDSGSLQKEAYFAKYHAITLDTVLSLAETVEDGWNIVVGEETIANNYGGKYHQCCKIFRTK